MKTLVIHPTDYSTRFLTKVYDDQPTWTIVNSNISKSKLKRLIMEHDRIVMLGHGTEVGLIGYDRYIIDSSFVQILREKLCFAVWCNCDEFFEKYKLTGFYTGMIVSEVIETYLVNVYSDEDEVTKSNIEFASALHKAINSDDDKVEIMKEHYVGDTPLYKFNLSNLFHT